MQSVWDWSHMCTCLCNLQSKQEEQCVYVCAFIGVSMCLCLCVCANVYASLCARVSAHVSVWFCVCVVHSSVYPRVCVCVCVCMCDAVPSPSPLPSPLGLLFSPLPSLSINIHPAAYLLDIWDALDLGHPSSLVLSGLAVANQAPPPSLSLAIPSSPLTLRHSPVQDGSSVTNWCNKRDYKRVLHFYIYISSGLVFQEIICYSLTLTFLSLYLSRSLSRSLALSVCSGTECWWHMGL